MKAFEISYPGESDDLTFIYVNETASKAKYHFARECADYYTCLPVGQILVQLKCKRRQDLDKFLEFYDEPASFTEQDLYSIACEKYAANAEQ